MATSKKVCILTGSSKGLGHALLHEYLNAGYFVFHCSRTSINPINDREKHYAFSLNDLDEIKSFIDEVNAHEQTQNADRIVLINNAGRLGQVSGIQGIEDNNLNDTITLNLTSAMLTISHFLKAFYESDKELNIINISSGAANSAIHGWSAYSASKAGMDAMTRTVATELESRAAKSRILSVYPGVVDTPMQAQIRSKNEDDFPRVNYFKELKSNNILTSPSSVARKVRHIDEDLDIRSGEIVDVRSIDFS